MNVLGVKLTNHNTGAALISDERIIAVSEERLDRVKHSGAFPALSIEYCLNAFGLEPKDIDHIVMDQVDLPSMKPMKDIFERETGGRFHAAAFHVINHHDAHAASAFFCSPFAEAAVLVYDGAGEKFVTHLGVAAIETESLYSGSDTTLSLIQKTLHRREEGTFPATSGIGGLYTRISDKYLGFGRHNEGKMMGLAPYGSDSLLKLFPLSRWFRNWNGHIMCNGRITAPMRSMRSLLRRKETFLWKVAHLVAAMQYFVKKKIGRWGRMVFQRKNNQDTIFQEINLPRPPREPDQALPDEYYASVAWAGQHILEKVAVAWGKQLKSATHAENICIAGGVGLNIDANKKFVDEVGFKRLFVQPAASDTGIPLGCALWGWHVICQQPRFWNMQSASLGRSYTEKEILSAADRVKDRISMKKSSQVAEEAARLLAEGKIIGWFQGGSEYGPRALGHRSIVCDPRPNDMKDVLNMRVKHREPWRPFAASILREHLSEWFELETESPFMLLAAHVRSEKRSQIPAVVHVDGTTRIQTVSKEANGRYYDLLKAFHRITGIPLVLNTSFNDSGEPIVETPEEATNDLLKTDIDCLVMGDYVLTKKNNGRALHSK